MAPPRGTTASSKSAMGPPKTSSVKCPTTKLKASRPALALHETSSQEQQSEAYTDNAFNDAASSSKGSEGDSLLALIHRMNQDRANRKLAQRRKLHQEHSTRVTKTRTDITTFFDTHAKSLIQVHKMHLQRLNALLARKAELETKMAESVKRLREGHGAHVSDLELVLDARIRQLEG